MTTIVAILMLKLVTLTGSIATTTGFVGLFAFRETLAPHLAALWVGGLLAIRSARAARGSSAAAPRRPSRIMRRTAMPDPGSTRSKWL